MKIFLRQFLAPALALVMLAACGQESAPAVDQVQDSTPNFDRAYVVAVNHPLQYFAQRLLNEAIEVRLLAPPGTDPAQWQPSSDQVLVLQGAALVLLNGADYSRWLNKVSLSEKRLVVTAGAAEDQWISLEKQITHSHGPEGEHAHGGYAFTTWLDMRLAQVQARAVAEAFAQRWPEQGDVIDSKLAELLSDLEALDEGYHRAAEQLVDYQFVYSHPVYQYFERRYKLPGRSLHWEPDTMPDEQQWRELEQLKTPATLFIWEAKPSEEISQRMASLGVTSTVVDPAANAAEQDWLAVQRANVARLTGLGY